MRTVIFSDLDGTLLDAETYSFDAARPALERIRLLGVPLVLTSSKTRAEMELWRERIGNRDPFIVENGGAVVMPDRSIVFGDPYPELVAVLRAAAEQSGCKVRGFHELNESDVSALSGLPAEDAQRALAREFDEPFEILEGEPARLTAAIEARGKRWTTGGRFYHITGNNDKGRAVRTVANFYRELYGELRTVGIGDGWNDVPMFLETDVAIVLAGAGGERIKAAIPAALMTYAPGPVGWNDAVLGVLYEIR